MEAIDLYARPAWYDALHAEGTASWADWLVALNARHGNGGTRWLEPACGTGRFFPVLARRRVRLTGYDSDERPLVWARRRGDALRADMTGFSRLRAFDFAFSVLGSFRHLLEERDARRHLELTRRSLKPGGLYALGLDLCDYASPEPDEEVWLARRGRLRLKDVVETVPPEPVRRRERVIHFLEEGGRLYQSEYDLRSYDWRQFSRTFTSAGFRLVAAYDGWRRPIVPDAATRDALFLLGAAGS